MHHVLYGLIEGHRKRRQMGELWSAAPDLATSEVDLAGLKAAGVEAMVFDFDGVLAPHGAAFPLDSTRAVLEGALELFGPNSVFILSNKPSAERLTWFQQHYPAIVFVGDVRKKPYPDGLLKISSLAGLVPDKIALVDDRLMTGGLACLNSGSRLIYISKPLCDYATHPFKETFFATLRSFEVALARFAV